MPLAFTLKDFLVIVYFSADEKNRDELKPMHVPLRLSNWGISVALGTGT